MLRIRAACLAAGTLLLAAPALAQSPPSPQQTRITRLLVDDGPPENAAPAPPVKPLDARGYRRPDIVGPIHDGRFEGVPDAGLDNARYYAQTISDLANKCPNLGLEQRKDEILPYVFANAFDLIRRARTGDITSSEGFQLIWVALLGLNQHWSCRYNPLGPQSREAAQARCDEAGSVPLTFPSIDAAHDVTVMLGRHGCAGPETQRYADNVIAFLRDSYLASQLTGRLPPPSTALGRVYARILRNCGRTAGDNAAEEWCNCYAQTLHRIRTPKSVLDALGQNPFVDGSYITWVARNVPGGSELYACERAATRLDRWRAGYAPRTTACLIGDKPAGDLRECAYRASWVEFVMLDKQCKPSLDSKRWGYREVDCAKNAEAAPPAGAREWKDGIYTMIDYEKDVTPDFTPPLPADAEKRVPLTIRLRSRRNTERLLTELALAPPIPMHFRPVLSIRMQDTIAAELKELQQEKQLILSCLYRESGGVWHHNYWFRKAPKVLSERARLAKVNPHPFDSIRGVATTCPAAMPR